MAFDMYCADEHAAIDAHEQYLLVMASQEPQKYPELAQIFERFYDSPTLMPHQANVIVHELITLLSVHHADKLLTRLIVRLLPLFSLAYRTDQEIRCASD